MSPKTFQALPKSPASGGRRSSSGGSGNLRPVIPFGLDDGSALDEDLDELDEPEMGPMPTGRTQPFAAGEGGKGVDEVEVSLTLSIHHNILSNCLLTRDPMLQLYSVHVRRVTTIASYSFQAQVQHDMGRRVTTAS